MRSCWSKRPSASTSWYIEKLGLKKAKIELDEPEGGMALVFPKEVLTAIVPGPPSSSRSENIPMFYTGDIDGARKWLTCHGVEVGAIEHRQGTLYFAMQELEGNATAVSEEP